MALRNRSNFTSTSLCIDKMTILAPRWRGWDNIKTCPARCRNGGSPVNTLFVPSSLVISGCLQNIILVKNHLDKKVLLRYPTRHTVRRVASTRSAVLFLGGGWVTPDQDYGTSPPPPPSKGLGTGLPLQEGPGFPPSSHCLDIEYLKLLVWQNLHSSD